MQNKNATPNDLAKTVHRRLNGKKAIIQIPNVEILTSLFETIFYASLKTEESQLVKVTITLIDPKNPDPNPPEDIPQDRWDCISFKERIPFTVKSLVKISKAADPWSSSLAVYYDQDNQLFIWGMIDQALHNQTFLNYERDFEPEKPGLFQTTITGIGNLSVMFDYELIANLKQNILINKYINVFKYGPISAKLNSFSASIYEFVVKFLEKHIKQTSNDYWDHDIENLYKDTISRILLRIQNYQHGGSILITKNLTTELEIKHTISYSRLSNSIQFSFIDLISRVKYLEEIVYKYIEPETEVIPTLSCLKYVKSINKHDQVSSELKGCIRFISSLTCIDGLVVMTPDLKVMGFGTIINFKEPPEFIYNSPIATINESKLIKTKSNTFGTRHQSMITYCWNNPDALGFVVSQDGDIRAFSRIEDKVIMWENLKVLQFKKSNKLRNISIKTGN